MRMSCKRFLFAFVLVGLTYTTSVQAGNWPRFRGPNGQGINDEADFPAQWSEQGKVWSVELDGRGHASPVVWDNLVFVTLAQPDRGQVSLKAIQVTDGKTLWRKQYTLRPLKMNRLNSAAASTPAVDADHVYAVWHGRGQTLVTALDHGGREVWTRDFGPTFLTHGPCVSLIVYQDQVIFNGMS